MAGSGSGPRFDAVAPALVRQPLYWISTPQWRLQRRFATATPPSLSTRPTTAPSPRSSVWSTRPSPAACSGHDLGICDAAYLHSCAAAANCTLPSDILSYQRVDDLLTQPIEIRDSYAIVPDRPGLGFELDEEAVRRYQVRG